MSIYRAHAVNASKLRFRPVETDDRVAETDLEDRADKVVEIAAAHAAIVDERAAFPDAAIRATRQQRLLGIMVPREFGGDGADLSTAATLCYRFARACASTGMIYAMHQSNVACLVKHTTQGVHRAHILRRIADDQTLLASSTTEGQRGANLRSSEASLERSDDNISLERQATVISYGAHADGILTVARRSGDSAGSDQILALFFKEDYSLEPLNGWNALGMRGTCSAGFRLRARGGHDQVLPEPYEKINQRTMMPACHLLWASVWAGIAAGAVERARLFVRKSTRQTEGQLPPAATHFAKATASLRALRGLVSSSLDRYEKMQHQNMVESFDFQTSMNLLKVSASELAVSTVMSAFQASGLAGYRNDTEFSIGRHIRDILSSSIMINNDRILSNSLTPSLLNGVPENLFD